MPPKGLTVVFVCSVLLVPIALANYSYSGSRFDLGAALFAAVNVGYFFARLLEVQRMRKL